MIEDEEGKGVKDFLRPWLQDLLDGKHTARESMG